MKYSEALTNRIAALIAKDDYTVEEICKAVRISEAIFFKWKVEKLEFLDAIKKAEEKRLDRFKQAARSGLLTLLQGKEFVEVTTEYKGRKIISQKKTKKIILPNPTAVIFALKNVDKENFKDIVNQEVEQNTTLTANVNQTITQVRTVVFKTRQTTAMPQTFQNPQNN